MADNKTCPHCGKPVPPTALGDLCPECMLKAGLATQTEGPGAAGETGPRFVPPPVGEIARLFPQLEIIRLIGQGGMGAVYKARQPSLDRFVALKVLPPAAASDPGFAERFNREARALARLNHPNIVAVHDFGKAGTLHYLVMEFVDGANLREVERLGELTPEQALAIVPQICEALQFAHNEGIVHRDIKPENLLLDKRGRVKITDFGIAKMVGVGTGHQNLTGAKDVVGTPHYMAPEQIEKPLSVDHRADIYSLGVVFYEMLTGELPLGKFQPPSKKVQIDVRLDEVVLHALEKEPNRRYQQASQVKSAVETIVTTPGETGPANPNEPAPTTAQIEAARQRLKIPARGLVAAGALLVLFALGLLVFAMPAIASEGGGLAGYAAVSFGAAVFLLFATVVFLGAHSMTKLRNHSLSIAASVVAAFAGPGALLGLPFGIWACLELIRPEVRAAFAATRQREGKAVPTSSETQNQRPPAAAALRHGSRVALLLFLLIAGAAAVITLLMPKDYVATATVRLTGPEPTDPYHLQTEAEIIQSQPVLEPVAESLNLSQRWGQKTAAGGLLSEDLIVVLMKQRIQVQPIRNTALLEISFHSDSAAEAAEVANKIAATYCARPPGHTGEIIDPAVAPGHPHRPKILLNLFIGMIAGGIIGIFVGTGVGLISFWRMRTASPPHIQQPDRFWRHFAVSIALVLLTLILVPVLMVLLAMFAPALNRLQNRMDAAHHENALPQNAGTNFFIGQAWFPQGDSIEITSAERTPEKMVVKGHYNLVSHDQATLALYITVTNENVPKGSGEVRPILKGTGDFALVYVPPVPGLPHVSMYADGHPFASLYFGTREEAQEESKAGWITNSTRAPKFSERFAAIIRHGSNAPASSLQFRLVLPDNSTAPADWLPSASSSNQFRLSRQVLLDDTAIARAGVDFSPDGRRQIEIRFTDAGAKQFEAITATNIGHQLAIVFRGRVLSAPFIQSIVAGNQCQVDGSMKASEVDEIVDCLNRVAIPLAGAWNFSPAEERILPFKTQPPAVFGWLDLDSGTVLTSAKLDWESRTGYEWIRTNGFDVVTTESAKHFSALLGFDMVIAPAPTNGWDIVNPADVVNNWTLLQAEPRQVQFLAAIPGQTDTFIFQTREGGKGILQILGFADSPPGVKVRYKLVQPGTGTSAEQNTAPENHVNLVVANSGTAPLTYQWYLQNTNPPATGDRLRFGPVNEQILYSISRPPYDEFSYLDLDTGRLLSLGQAKPAVDPFNTEDYYDWRQKSGADVVAQVINDPTNLPPRLRSNFRGLVGLNTVLLPVDKSAWDNMSPQAVVVTVAPFKPDTTRWTTATSLTNGLPATHLFKTSEGGVGLLQITGFKDNPPGVKIRYKLVQAENSSEAIDSATGLPVGQHSVRIDSSTGLPISAGGSTALDPATGLPVTTAALDDSRKIVAAAGKWLTLVDRGNYSESWNEASVIFRGGVTEAGWENSMNTFRKPLGKRVSRNLKSAQEMTELPGAPDGHYVLMQFDTAFANKKSTVETVTFMLEKDGHWKAAGYYIK